MASGLCIAVVGATDAAGLPEVEPTRQLADHHEIGTLDHLSLERRGVDEHREALGRAEVRVEVELLADRQETPLGPLLVGHVVPLGAADGAEEDRVRATAELERAGGQRRARRVDRGAAHEAALELELGARALGHALEHANGLGRHFLADAVSRQNRDSIRRHHPTSRM